MFVFPGIWDKELISGFCNIHYNQVYMIDKEEIKDELVRRATNYHVRRAHIKNPTFNR
jgi:hypothetical protein